MKISHFDAFVIQLATAVNTASAASLAKQPVISDSDLNVLIEVLCRIERKAAKQDKAHAIYAKRLANAVGLPGANLVGGVPTGV